MTTRINSTWLASQPISALDIFFSMLFHLQLVKKAIFLCFLLLSYCLFHFFFDNSISDKNPRLILKLGIPTYVPMTSFNEKTETSLSASDKASKVLSENLSIVIQLLGVWRNSLCHWCLQSIILWFYWVCIPQHYIIRYKFQFNLSCFSKLCVQNEF